MVSPNDLEEINRARQSRQLLETLLAERQDHLINILVKDYRSNKWSNERALGSIAEIAGMKEQIDKLSRIMRGAV
jgi:NADH:ubiquinone oxidoreductase subunit E